MLMLATQRVPLIKQVVTPLKMDKTVRIVHQARDRRQMPARVVAIAKRDRLAFHHGL